VIRVLKHEGVVMNTHTKSGSMTFWIAGWRELNALGEIRNQVMDIVRMCVVTVWRTKFLYINFYGHGQLEVAPHKAIRFVVFGLRRLDCSCKYEMESKIM
jgi:hypothetical protein